tara:strand:- start:249 stop:623 length:375 start_codon:yes stop_codon:yes gene_type:complete
MSLRYFNHSEFDSPDLPDSGKNMDNTFLDMLDNARAIAGISFDINSGYRTEQHNAKVGGKPKTAASKGSSHMYGYAADIAVQNGAERWIVVKSLIDAGFKRIGIAKTFIHTDNDPDKPNAIWSY